MSVVILEVATAVRDGTDPLWLCLLVRVRPARLLAAPASVPRCTTHCRLSRRDDRARAPPTRGSVDWTSSPSGGADPVRGTDLDRLHRADGARGGGDARDGGDGGGRAPGSASISGCLGAGRWPCCSASVPLVAAAILALDLVLAGWLAASRRRSAAPFPRPAPRCPSSRAGSPSGSTPDPRRGLQPRDQASRRWVPQPSAPTSAVSCSQRRDRGVTITTRASRTPQVGRARFGSDHG